MTTIITRGSVSAQALGYAARSTAANYIEDVFSTYLYAGNGGTQTITNSIDLSTKGGLVWIKNRTLAAGHAFTDTARGAGTGTAKASTNILQSNDTGGTGGGLPASSNDYLSAFTTTGFTVVSSNGANDGTKTTNRSSSDYVAWSFREQAKFFDIVTYTGTGANRTISHNLGSVPGSIFVKRTDTTGDWQVYHRSLANTEYMVLNSTAAVATGATRWNSTTPTSTVFSLGTDATVNASGGTYVAYLFAHDAGGFGASGADNVITCGSFTTDGSENSTTNLGYEPQWLMLKATSGSTAGSQPWRIFDSMRGLTVAGQDDASLQPNQTNAESQVNRIGITSTGFTTNAFGANTTLIYIAIRRGPMRTPTSGTSVFAPAQATSNGTSTTWTTNFPVDFALFRRTALSETGSFNVFDRLRGASAYGLFTASTDAQGSFSNAVSFDLQTTFKENLGYASSTNILLEAFRRAPGFFDEVCYTGDGGFTVTRNHNLAAQPELIIVKSRGSAQNWAVAYRTSGTTYLYGLELNTTSVSSATTYNYGASMSATTFNSFVGSNINQSETNGVAYVAYLFATCPGVSKVGSYTGTGALQTVNCGFTSGARFVLIKRTDSTGDWYVYDSARGITSGNDPYLLLNDTAAEVTSTNYVDTDTTGFKVTAAAPAGLNANGGTYIFLAIA